jgi:hypothetical protein
MPLGTIFWVLMIIWFVFGLVWNWPTTPGPRAMMPIGGHVLIFILFFIVGWRLFGFVIQNN